MQEIIFFARLLRGAGLVIAPSEISEAHQGLALMGNPAAGPAHYDVLRSTLVKRSEDLAVFASLYQLFFGDEVYALAGQEKAHQAPGQGLKASDLPTLAQALLSGEPCRSRVRDAVRQLKQRDEVIDEQVRKVLVSLDYFGSLNSIRLAKERGKLTEWEHRTALDNGSALISLVQAEVLKDLLQHGENWTRIARHLNWREKSFNSLSSAEMCLVKACLDKIGKKLATRPSLKGKPAGSGRLDLRVTARQALARGGGIWSLAYNRQVPAKPDLVLLCDVSNSVYRFTGFLLQLVAAFRERFHQIRAFLFVDILWEIPGSLLSGEIGEVLADIRENNRCSLSGLSDFGQVFCQFEAAVLGQLNPKSTLLILADGRNNWRPPETSTFKKIAAGLRRVYWLNPLPREEWGREDCQLHLYSPHCSGVFECGSLQQLQQVAAQILL